MLEGLPPFTGGLVGYFSSDDIEIAGASPETLVKLEDGHLSTFPLAGTRPRGRTKEEDRELEEGLLKDEKELAEHNMLVDLGRNDIGKISKIGTVQVEKYMTVEHFSHVMHLGSTVTGIIRNDRCGGRHSPGPGRPADAGICIPVIRHFAGKVPIFGVCLGHQAICKAFGGTVSYAKELMHGKKKLIHKTGESQLFKGLDETFPAVRYHSLAALEETLPEELRVTARSDGGSNAIGSFYHFIEDPEVQLIGCEAAGRGVNTAETAATIATGRLGIFHGMKSYFCQDEYGQIAPVYSISAGLDYPGVGPEHAHLYDIGRAQYVPVTDDEAVEAFEYLSRTEEIIPAIESAHAVAYARKLAPTMDKEQIIVVTISGRGDKDCAAIARYRGEDLHE